MSTGPSILLVPHPEDFEVGGLLKGIFMLINLLLVKILFQVLKPVEGILTPPDVMKEGSTQHSSFGWTDMQHRTLSKTVHDIPS